jgi:hypothetical protein
MNKTNINQQLSRAFFALTIVGALFTLPSAKAGPPVSASGISTDRECVIENVTNGPNTITTLKIKAYLTGTLTGTVCGTERDVGFPDGSVTINATGVFTGTVNGSAPGTAVLTSWGEAGQGSPGGRFGGVGAAVSWVMDQGTGGLAGVHGQGAFGTLVDFAEGPGCGNNTDPCITPDYYDFTFTLLYSGQIQFAP